ncbi:MAG: TonB-dependent receptor [Pseudomonadales bacterium]|nr:TonB-dependent receptor [Pseudomonadales bacterium]
MLIHSSILSDKGLKTPFTCSTKFFLATAVTISTALLAQPLSAQENGDVEEIIVTSSRVPIPLRQIGTSVSVLDELEIEARGNLQLSDVLRQMPAVGSTSNGGIGKNTTVRIRGEEGFRTLTYIDGMRLQDPSAIQIGTDFSQLLTDGIGRIEILRGPQGLAYGADAGGVININTRGIDDGLSVSLDGQTGRFGTSQLSGNVAGRSGAVDYFLSVTDYETDGFNTRDIDNVSPDDDGYENTSFHGRVGFDLTDEWRIDLVHRDVDGANEFDGCFDSATFNTVHDCTNDYDLSATKVGLEYNGESFTHLLSYTTTESDRQNFTLGLPAFGGNGEQERIEYIGSATNLPGFDLVFGADQQEDVNNGRGRDNTGVFLEYLSDFSDNLFFTAGVRHDDNDDFGTNTSYRLSGAYLIDMGSGTLKFKTALGTGFRAPSPFEIEYNRGSSAFPPASLVSLQQEESEGWEAGIEYFSGDLRLEAVYFDQDVENAIFFDLAAFSGYLQDVGTSTSQGIELTAEIPVNDSFRVTSNYTYNDTERPNGDQRLRRPENLFNLGLSYTGMNGRLNVNGFYRYQADSIDSPGPLDDFGVFDLTASFEINDSFRIYGRLENAFDEEYEEVIAYNSAERAAYVGVNFRFGE